MKLDKEKAINIAVNTQKVVSNVTTKSKNMLTNNVITSELVEK